MNELNAKNEKMSEIHEEIGEIDELAVGNSEHAISDGEEDIVTAWEAVTVPLLTEEP